MKLRILVCAATAAMSTAVAVAHHSLAGVYETNQQIAKEGVITRIQFTNPHPLFTMSVEDKSDKKKEARSWTLELDNLSELVEIGMTTSTFKPGDRVLVSGNPGRDNQERIYVLRMDRPADGVRYEQIGYTPRLGKIPPEEKPSR